MLVWFFLLFWSVAAFSQTGKVTGTVKDSQNGSPLIGVNVIVKGTTIGAATDINGYYAILGVPPGPRDLAFSYIGYAEITVTEVLVNTDRTTTINIEMTPAALDLGQAVTVTAERPIVEKDKTSSSVHIQAEDIAKQPIVGLREILELTPGVNRNADGTISIRGGSGYDINYTVNGMKSLNTNTSATAFGGSGMSKSENSWKYDVNPLSVAQMEIISGGFNSEYGNAQSGIISVVTKEGGEKFSGGFRVEYRPPGQYHWGDYLYSHDQREWELWGDIDTWLGQSSFKTDSAAVNNYNLWVMNHTPGNEDVVLYQYNPEAYIYDSYVTKNRDNIMGVYDYRKNAYQRYLFSFGGPLGADGDITSFFISGEYREKPTRLPTVEQVQKLSNFTAVVAYKPSPKHNFKITNMYQYYEGGMGSGSDDIRWAGLNRGHQKYTLIYDALREETVSSQNLDYKYVFSSTAYLEIGLIHQFEELFSLQQPVPGIDKDAQLVAQGKQDTRYLEDRGDWFMLYRDYYTWSSLYNQASLTHFWEGRASYSNQVNKRNLVKVGMEASLMDQDFNASSSLTVSSFIWRTGFSTNYRAKTKYLAAFAQDKIEFAGMVANLGLRMDAYNFGGKVPLDEHQAFYPAENEGFDGGVGIPAWKNSKTFIALSPRIGISFPISDRSAFRVQYGHFRSMPIVAHALDNQTNHGWGIIGNPNLEPKLSINYEIGLQHNLWNTHLLDIVTYYNDMKNQIHTIYVETTAGSIKYGTDYYGTYRTYSNNSYGSSQGIEINFTNRNISDWHYRIGYALSQTKYGYTGLYIEPTEVTTALEQKYTYSASEFTSSEDRTHRLNASLSYSIPGNSGPELFDIRPLSNLIISMIYSLHSGAAYFWSPDYVTDTHIESNRRYPLEATTNVQIEKKIVMKNVNLSASVRIKNLFNNRHLTQIGNSAELDRWVERSATYLDADNDPYREYRIYYYYQAYRNIPREVYFTLGFDF